MRITWMAAAVGSALVLALTGSLRAAPAAGDGVSAAGPTLTAQASASVPIGGSLTGTATLEGGASPTGTITFRVFGPGDLSCAAPLATTTVPVSGNGSYASAPFTPVVAGTYQWTASYGGDAGNDPAAPAHPCADPAAAVIVRGPAFATGVVTADGPITNMPGSTTATTAPCAPGSVLVGGGVRGFYTGVDTAGYHPINGLVVKGSAPSGAGGTPSGDGATDPSAWTGMTGFAGQSEADDTMTTYAMCATGGPAHTTVVSVTVPGPGLPQTTARATATCPAGTRLVGGGARVTSVISTSIKPVGSYPSDASGSTTVTSDPDSWTAIGQAGGQTDSGVQTTAWALCSTDASLHTQVVRAERLDHPAGPGNGDTPGADPRATVVATCPAGTRLLQGGALASGNAAGDDGGIPQQGVQLKGSFPSDATGATVANGAASPSSWTAMVQSGGQATPGTDSFAFVLCAQPAVTTSADVSISKARAPAVVVVGEQITYTLAVENDGPSAASDVVVTDPLPAGVAFVSAATDAGSCANDDGTVTCWLGNLAAAGTATVTIVVAANASGAPENTATVSAVDPDPVPLNNSSTAVTTVGTPTADVSIANAGTPDPVVVGSQITYSLTVANAGPEPATSVTIADPLPAGTAFSSASASQGTCTHLAGTVTCPLGAIAAGGSATASIVVTTTAAGAPANTATVTAGQLDPDPGDNEATATTTVLKAAPSLAAQASAATTVGGSLTDTATVAGGFSPTGTIGYDLYGPADPTCAGPPLLSTTRTVAGNGAYTSAAFTPAAPGTYRWIASYGGDANNHPLAAGACSAAGQATAVSKAGPTLSTQASAAVTVGGSVSDTATLAGGASPTGTIAFSLYGPGDATCAGAAVFTDTKPVAGNGPTTSASFVPSSSGVYRWIASYGGDAGNEAVAGACNAANQAVSVGSFTPTLSAQASADVSLGAQVTDTATLSGGSSPTGTIVFRLYGPGDATSAGTPAYMTTATVAGNGAYTSSPFTPGAPGTYRWVASYGGDAGNDAVSGGCNDAGQAVEVGGALSIQVVAADRPVENLAASQTPATVTCPAGTVLVGGGVRAFTTRTFDPLDPYHPINGLVVRGSMASDAAGSLAGNGAAAPGSWTALAGFAGQSEPFDAMTGFAMCASGGPAHTVVVSVTVDGPVTAQTTAMAIATCPGGTRLVGGGAMVVPASQPSVKPVGSYPSDATGSRTVTSDPDSWTAVGESGGLQNSPSGAPPVQTTALAICSTDVTLHTTVARAGLLDHPAGPGNGNPGSDPIATVTATCPDGTRLLGGGALAIGGAPGDDGGNIQQGVHLRGSYPSDGAAAAVGDGAANPDSWSAIVQSGGQSTPGTDSFAYALCALTGPPPAERAAVPAPPAAVPRAPVPGFVAPTTPRKPPPPR